MKKCELMKGGLTMAVEKKLVKRLTAGVSRSLKVNMSYSEGMNILRMKYEDAIKRKDSVEANRILNLIIEQEKFEEGDPYYSSQRVAVVHNSSHTIMSPAEKEISRVSRFDRPSNRRAAGRYISNH